MRLTISTQVPGQWYKFTRVHLLCPEDHSKALIVEHIMTWASIRKSKFSLYEWLRKYHPKLYHITRARHFKEQCDVYVQMEMKRTGDYIIDISHGDSSILSHPVPEKLRYINYATTRYWNATVINLTYYGTLEHRQHS